MYYIGDLAKDLHCDQEELQEFIKYSGVKYKISFGTMKISEEDIEVIKKQWEEQDSIDKDKLILNGRNGSVRVEKGVVSISRKGFMGYFASGTLNTGDKSIFIKNIISVEIGKKPSEVSSGISYIRFVTAGENEVKDSYTKFGLFENRAGQLFSDPNTIQISRNTQYEIALKIRDYIENYQANQGTPPQALSGADEILKYKKLLDDGILSQEEFDIKKKQLLGL